MAPIPGPLPARIEDLETTLLKAYGLSSLKMMLYHKLGVRLEEEVNPQTRTR